MAKSQDGPEKPAPPPSPPRRLFLIDAMSYIFRAYHALPKLTNRSGLATNAVYGLHNMLRKLLATYEPDYVVAAFDLAGPTFRHESFADYKANREEMPEDLAEQLPYIRQLLEAMQIPVLAQPGYEADDVIGALARQGAEQNLEVFIVSSDKDMMQLVNERVALINPMKEDSRIDREKVIEQLGVAPEQVPDLLALQGDSVDNIPGAPGIGEKGARELIQKYGGVEACLDRASEVARKTYREALLNYKAQILLSKQLATIDATAPVALSLEELRRREADRGKLRELFQELGFTSLLKDLLPAAEARQQDYQEIADEDSLRDFLRGFSSEQAVALAVHSEQGQPKGTLLPADLPEVSLCPAPGVARSIAPALFTSLKVWLEDAQTSKAVHDSKSALLALQCHGVRLAGVRHDTMLYSYLLDANESNHRLEDVVESRLGVKLAENLAERADRTGQLVSLLEPEVRAAGLDRLYAEMELPLVPVLAEMESWGIKLNVEPLQKLSVQTEGELEKLRQKIYELTGTEFNINSPKQLGEVLFEKLGLPAPRKRGKSKAISTAVDVLEELAALHEAPRRVLEYRQLAKLKSTYIDALPQLVNPATGRLHTQYNQAGTATGRLSSSNPNLQNIPIRTKLGREIRAAFIAEPGFVLLAADYSQIELRLLAHLSEDPLLLEAFRRGDDIHALTATAVFGVPPQEQTPEHRRRAKAINYGIVYGISAFGLAQQLGTFKAEAEEYINQYFHRYEGVRKFIDNTLDEVRQSLQVRTLFGRLRRIPEINSKDFNARQFAERIAINTPLQGTAADLMKLAMLRVHRELREREPAARLILQVHDELVLEVPKDQVQETAALVRSAMEQAHPFKVPLVAEVAAGPNWRDMEDVQA
ncbi:MAG: DNA polymerase I [Acidobacteria bacterium RIFCSPLOWO2_12_FULL_59_11]|nr:MAG: DNA polymerase I [Acidobacteria bacterium RIFCSPLOWO2_12_FULL_59_11]